MKLPTSHAAGQPQADSNNPNMEISGLLYGQVLT
jgi:hypothetical protein